MLRRLLKAALGFALILVGLVLSIPGVPGPGLALVVLGLVVLSDIFPWAERLLAWAKRKVKELRRPH